MHLDSLRGDYMFNKNRGGKVMYGTFEVPFNDGALTDSVTKAIEAKRKEGWHLKSTFVIHETVFLVMWSEKR